MAVNTGLARLRRLRYLYYTAKQNKDEQLPIFTARGYAKHGICRRRVSVCVCLCVCHTPVLYQNGYT